MPLDNENSWRKGGGTGDEHKIRSESRKKQRA